MAEQQVSTNKFSNYKWIVDAVGLDQGATHTTIQAAIDSADPGESIFVRPGTYTQDLTLKAEVQLVGDIAGFSGGFPKIVGKITATDAGTHNIIGFEHETNGDFGIVVSGANDVVLYLNNLKVLANDNTYVSYTNSSLSSLILFDKCFGSVTGGGTNTFFVNTSNSTMQMDYCNFRADSSTLQESTISSGSIRMNHTTFSCPIETTGTATIRVKDSNLNPQGIAPFVINQLTGTSLGGEDNLIHHTRIRAASPTNPAINIGAGSELFLHFCDISSSNVNVITGTGEIEYGGLVFDASNELDSGLIQNPRKELHGPISFDGGTSATTFLDEYEEGTWTPFIFGITAAGVGTYSTQVGQYTRVGNRVFINAYIIWTAHTGTGGMQVGGLPFVGENVALAFSPVAIWYNNFAFTAGNNVEAYVQSNTTNVVMNQVAPGGGILIITMDTAASFMLQGSYQTDA